MTLLAIDCFNTSFTWNKKNKFIGFAFLNTRTQSAFNLFIIDWIVLVEALKDYAVGENNSCHFNCVENSNRWLSSVC